MHKRFIYFILACTVLLIQTSCVSMSREVKSRLNYGEFSILPPDPQGWVYISMYPNNAGAVLAKQGNKPAIQKSYVFSFLTQRSEQIKALTGVDPLESNNAFRKSIEKQIALDDAGARENRSTDQKKSFQIKEMMGTVCIYRTITGHDKKHYNAEMTVVGYTCKHPENPHKIVDISASIRSLEPIPNRETESMIEKTMNTLIFQ